MFSQSLRDLITNVSVDFDYLCVMLIPSCLPAVSLDNVMADVNSIKRGIVLVRNEYEAHKHPVLKEFLEHSQDKVAKVSYCLH